MMMIAHLIALLILTRSHFYYGICNPIKKHVWEREELSFNFNVYIDIYMYLQKNVTLCVCAYTRFLSYLTIIY